ncbi:hypothetical protein [Nodularia chucula]|uniref:hypothetical protein n=1 Tax=Nodularia chucula TaxID=3093667 RepID=UPI0039C61EF7
MANDNPKDLYNQVCKRIYPEIKGIKRGILYNTILRILCEDTSQYQEETKKICDYFGIKDNSYPEEDQKIIDKLLDTILRDNPIIKEPAKIVKNLPGGNMEWVFVAAAFTFVGLFIHKKNLDKNEVQKTIPPKASEGTEKQPISQLSIPADICLIVPASIASNFINSENLKVDDLTYLIDNTSYFLCTTVKVAESNETNLQITDEDILPDSRQEVYMRINIKDGRNLIDKKVLYILKRNLPTNEIGVIKKIACLTDLSGLEKFNRV